MKKTIWKFPLKVADRQTIKMPSGAQILSVMANFNTPYIYALVIPDAEPEERFIEIFGTGHDINYDMGVDRVFVGTFKIEKQDLFIGHVFERIN
jgi:hypothetical protein